MRQIVSRGEKVFFRVYLVYLFHFTDKTTEDWKVYSNFPGSHS